MENAVVADIFGHDVVDTVCQLHRGDALVFLRLDDGYQMQLHIRGLQPQGVVKHLVGVGQGANGNGNAGLLGDFEYYYNNAKVQGEGAAENVCEGIKFFNENKYV